MSRMVMDTGPLVAWLCPRDRHHAWAVETFQQLPAGCLVCEAVLAEACHLVRKDGVDPGRVLEFVERGGLVVVPLGGQVATLRQLMARYRSVGMDFGDACVVRLTELHPDIQVCTTDSDFRVYRRHGRQIIPLLAPFA